jgi:hypothetical protein
VLALGENFGKRKEVLSHLPIKVVQLVVQLTHYPMYKGLNPETGGTGRERRFIAPALRNGSGGRTIKW